MLSSVHLRCNVLLLCLPLFALRTLGPRLRGATRRASPRGRLGRYRRVGSEPQSVEVAGCLHGPAEYGPCLGHELLGVGEAARAKMSKDKAPYGRGARHLVRLGRRGVPEGVRPLGVAVGGVGLVDEQLRPLGTLDYARARAGVPRRGPRLSSAARRGSPRTRGRGPPKRASPHVVHPD
jgi:hypothetical protein